MGGRVLIIDWQMSPRLCWCDGDKIIQEEHPPILLSIAWKWLGEKKSDCLTMEDLAANEDSSLVDFLWRLLDECDIVVGYGTKSFGAKLANSIFAKDGYIPPSKYREIDLQRVFKGQFYASVSDAQNFCRDEMDTLEVLLWRLGGDNPQNPADWYNILSGNKNQRRQASAKMKIKGKRVIEQLEKLYNKLSPWTDREKKTIIKRPDSCPHCGANDVRPRAYRRDNGIISKVQYSCRNCGKCFTVALSLEDSLALMKERADS